MSKCSADETPVCCCMDVGTIMDNSDCTASYSRVFANRAEAEQTLAALTEKARSVESEPCKITPTFTEESDGVRLDIDFTFACEAEMLIFQSGSALIPLGYIRPCQLLAGAFSFLFFFSLCVIAPTFPFLHLAKCKKMVKTMIRSDHFIYFFTGECYGSGFTAGYPPGRSYRHC